MEAPRLRHLHFLRLQQHPHQCRKLLPNLPVRHARTVANPPTRIKPSPDLSISAFQHLSIYPMTELTAEKIRLVLLAVEAMRISGRIEPRAAFSHRQLERISYRIGEPVGREDFARLEQRALHKARLAALAIKARQSLPSDL